MMIRRLATLALALTLCLGLPTLRAAEAPATAPATVRAPAEANGEFGEMYELLKLDGPTAEAFLAKCRQRAAILAEWENGPKGKEFTTLRAAILKARDAKDEPKRQELEARLKPIDDECYALKVRVRADVLATLSLEQQKLWAGYVLWGRTWRAVRKLEMTEAQISQGKLLATVVAGEFLKPDTCTTDPYLKTLDTLRPALLEKLKARVLTKEQCAKLAPPAPPTPRPATQPAK